MIDYSFVRETVEGQVESSLTGVHIQYENTYVQDTVTEYVSVTEHDADSEPLECGSNVSIVRSLMVIRIFTPIGKGTKRAKMIASDVSKAVSLITVNNLTFGSPVLVSMGQVDEESNFYQHNLTIPYTYAFAGDVVNC